MKRKNKKDDTYIIGDIVGFKLNNKEVTDGTVKGVTDEYLIILVKDKIVGGEEEVILKRAQCTLISKFPLEKFTRYHFTPIKFSPLTLLGIFNVSGIDRVKNIFTVIGSDTKHSLADYYEITEIKQDAAYSNYYKLGTTP